jgi:CSLREA domain-containing protein
MKAAMMPVPVALAGANITVNTTEDVFPINGHDGKCTLREAITTANNNTVLGNESGECLSGSADNTINFDPALFVSGPQTINLKGILPGLLSNIIINGPGASILTVRRDTGGEYRIFYSGGQQVTISGLTISNGLVRGADGSRGGQAPGGAIYQGRNTTLTLRDSIISQNAAIGGTGTKPGGCIPNGGSDFSGGFANGGGIYNEGGVLNIINSTVSGNTVVGGTGSSSGGSGIGGAIFHGGGVLIILNSTISQNSATGGNGSCGPGGSGDGAAIFNGSSSINKPTVFLGNSTISQNSATGGHAAAFAGGYGIGGGIDNRGKLTLQNSTISQNSATGGTSDDDFFKSTSNGGGIFSLGPAAGINMADPVHLSNSIIAGNTALTTGPDVDGVFVSEGFNLIGRNDDSDLVAGNPNANQDIIGTSAAPVDPMLGPLAANGGPTRTHALLPGSPAIDKGAKVNFTSAGNPINTDQRGSARPFDDPSITNATGGDGSDIGAVEMFPIGFSQASYTVGEADGRATITVNRTGDTSLAATMQYQTSDVFGLANCDALTGLASARCDYTAVAGTLSFAAGQSSAAFTIPIIDDVYVEGPETLSITLSNATGDVLGVPGTASLIITDNDTPPGGSNPIDQRAFFIRQLYLDFLAREPEPAGLAAWLQILNNCPVGDIRCDEIEVASAFYRSPEFFDRSYFIYKVYEVALGRQPQYAEYQRDIRKVSGFLTDAELAARKQQFVLEFTQRPEFRNKYDQIVDSGAFVDTLLLTAGLQLDEPTRAVLISELANSFIQRWDVLRRVANSPQASQKYFNKAFVVVGYFAFLRRNPDINYLIWINRLNTTGDYRDMIRGFTKSPEYRSRFGPTN